LKDYNAAQRYPSMLEKMLKKMHFSKTPRETQLPCGEAEAPQSAGG
jgi:hypothetical protein